MQDSYATCLDILRLGYAVLGGLFNSVDSVVKLHYKLPQLYTAFTTLVY